MAYEIFRRNSARVEEPAIAIAAHGRIAFNASCTRLLEAAGVVAVKILWDKDKCGIALQATVKGDTDSYSVVFSPGRSASITARSFLKYIGWSANNRQTVPARYDHELRTLKAELPPRFVAGAVERSRTK